MTYFTANVSRREVEMNWGWAEKNPELFVNSVKTFMEENADAEKITVEAYPTKHYITLSAVYK